jgi:K+-transporting ATPase ATPase A chain
MTPSLAPGITQALVAVAIVLALAYPLGWLIAVVLDRESPPFERLTGPFERVFLGMCGTRGEGQTWRAYAMSVLLFSACGLLLTYGIQRVQGLLPNNPAELAGVAPDLAMNTAVSFVTNTNWQAYGGETTLSYATQMLALTTQNFVSAAVGICVVAAVARGIRNRRSEDLGNFWRDLLRGTAFILLPLSTVLALVLVSQGVVQTLSPYQEATLVQPIVAPDGTAIATQTLPLGPAASQVAIKQLGTNGGGFFSVNSAHPFENPTPLSNFLQTISIILLPAALCCSFGIWVRDRRQGVAILAAMTVLLVASLAGAAMAETHGIPAIGGLGIDGPTAMEGKETRFGVMGSILWAVFTTAASNGSVNAMHDSMTPLAGGVCMLLMQLGEVVFGGVGSGLYGMLLFVLVAVFVAGLMVGRTPEYLAKRIGPYDMKMAAIALLAPSAMVLIGTAVAVAFPSAAAAAPNPGPHGFSEILYAYSSAANNNGSAFGGLAVNSPFWNTSTALAMFVGRFFVIVPVLAIAGSLARKDAVAPSLGTLPTHTPLFVAFLIAIVLIVGVLTFVPALALGPVVEQLRLAAGVLA